VLDNRIGAAEGAGIVSEYRILRIVEASPFLDRDTAESAGDLFYLRRCIEMMGHTRLDPLPVDKGERLDFISFAAAKILAAV
jgi:hypothetical protein